MPGKQFQAENFKAILFLLINYKAKLRQTFSESMLLDRIDFYEFTQHHIADPACDGSPGTVQHQSNFVFGLNFKYVQSLDRNELRTYLRRLCNSKAGISLQTRNPSGRVLLDTWPCL
ncbi:MAG: hypothetical protein ACXWJZ_17805, partial [Burkholderiaceae bacterium]